MFFAISNCTNGTKSRKASHICLIVDIGVRWGNSSHWFSDRWFCFHISTCISHLFYIILYICNILISVLSWVETGLSLCWDTFSRSVWMSRWYFFMEKNNISLKVFGNSVLLVTVKNEFYDRSGMVLVFQTWLYFTTTLLVSKV